MRSLAIIMSAICGFVLLASYDQSRLALAAPPVGARSGYVRDASNHLGIPEAIVTFVGRVRWARRQMPRACTS